MIVGVDGKEVVGESEKLADIIARGIRARRSSSRSSETAKAHHARGRARVPSGHVLASDPEIDSLARDLALALREQVLPGLGSHAGREHAGSGEGGERHLRDRRAGRVVPRVLAERAPDVAFYSEDRGLVEGSGATE